MEKARLLVQGLEVVVARGPRPRLEDLLLDVHRLGLQRQEPLHLLGRQTDFIFSISLPPIDKIKSLLAGQGWAELSWGGAL